MGLCDGSTVEARSARIDAYFLYGDHE